MINQLQSIIYDIRLNFIDYLAKKNRPELVERIDQLFNYDVKSVNSLCKVSLKFKDLYIFEEEMSIEKLDDIPQKLKDSVRMIYNDELITKINLSYDGESVFEHDLKISTIKDAKSFLDGKKHIIYDAIGFVDVSLTHNKTGDLCDFKLNITKLEEIVDNIKEKEDAIYKQYIAVEKKNSQLFYSEGDVPISEFLNLIIDEFNNALSDENGNYIIWA